MSDQKLRFTSCPLRRTIEDFVVAPLAERMAKQPSWRDANIRIGASSEAGDLPI